MIRTHVLTRFWWAFLAIGALAVLLAVGLPATLTKGADHLDAPGLTSPGGDGRLDITDLYAFQSPTNSNNIVLIMAVNPLAGVLSDTTFHPEASYDLKIDTNGDAKEDITYEFTFSEPDGSGVQDVMLRRTPAGGGGTVLAEGQTGQDIALAGGGTLRIGLFDDPFFFDLNAFLRAYDFCFAPQGPKGKNGNDFFAGLNVTAIVLEVPRASLGPNNVGVWARTELNGRVDRIGRPAINTVFIPTDSKNAFNKGRPRNDSKDFSVFLGAFAGVLLPDILTVDTSSTAGFLNGRQLVDDVIDIELQIITGSPTAGDCVDANDVGFPGVFPYLAPAH